MIYQVYEKYNKDFVRYAKSLVKTKQDAQDIVQDAYVKGIEHEEIFENMNDYQIKGWFFRVIKNIFIDRIRKDRKIFFSDDERILTSQINMETDIYFYDMINILPEYLKTLIKLKYVDGLNSKEIGKIQDVSPSTIRNRLSLAINKLRDGGLMNE
ncbi:DNA-directed RNA polymerase subunit sigma [Vallitalea longa]|uniref:DNA-directed RNA polymerase subunit sigma n=1 Tax=Vallitalea longa TaxID=2936439 RepID=A0A9W6DFT6_9FIRM|nr:RNA polymerase sigma factor [Vallitalea longa]GKX30915.1 DNA-directed RNA polymerase subunit sigma [Vallitalea longa]